MEKVYRYRIYPNKKQRELMSKTFGCCRFVYNYFLDLRKEVWEKEKKTLYFYDCCKILTQLKREKEWLREPDKWALQNVLKDLDFAYDNFFKGKAGYPKYKTKKSNRFSYRTTNSKNVIRISNKRIQLPKLGWVKFKDKSIPQGKILNVGIIKEPSGKYFASICCTITDTFSLPKTGKSVGIDLGIKNFATTSDGSVFNNYKYLEQSLEKLAMLQRRLSRKTKGGSNWEKARIKVARLHEHISNQRKDYLQKLSTNLLKEYDIVCLETLPVSESISSSRYSRRFFDVSWYEFTRQLSYKASWYDKTVIKIDRWFASSQICNRCNYRNPDIKDLKIRVWVCPNCNSVLDRDVNAAKNILKKGLESFW